MLSNVSLDLPPGARIGRDTIPSVQNTESIPDLSDYFKQEISQDLPKDDVDRSKKPSANPAEIIGVLPSRSNLGRPIFARNGKFGTKRRDFFGNIQ